MDNSIQDIETLFQDIQKHPDRKVSHLERIIGKCNILIQEDASNTRVYCYRAVAFNSQGRKQEALADLDKATTLEPKNPFYWHMAAKVALALGDAEGAIERVGKAIELNERNPNFYVTEGKAYEANHEYGFAALAYSNAINLGLRSAEIYVRRVGLIEKDIHESGIRREEDKIEAEQDLRLAFIIASRKGRRDYSILVRIGDLAKSCCWLIDLAREAYETALRFKGMKDIPFPFEELKSSAHAAYATK